MIVHLDPERGFAQQELHRVLTDHVERPLPVRRGDKEASGELVRLEINIVETASQ